MDKIRELSKTVCIHFNLQYILKLMFNSQILNRYSCLDMLSSVNIFLNKSV